VKEQTNMQRSIILRNVCPCGIAAALEALAEEARTHLGPNHPYYPMLEVLRAEKHMLPLSINLPDDLADYGLYSEPPNPRNPWGTRVLEVAVRLCAGCPYHHSPDLARAGGAGGEQGCVQGRDRGHGCAKACTSELTVHIAQQPEFPFPPADVDSFLYHYFNMPELATATVPRNFRFTYAVAHQCGAAAAAPSTDHDAPVAGDEPGAPDGAAAHVAAPGAPAPGTCQPVQRRKPGAPQLYCNVWLLGQVSVLADPRQCSHLKPRWQELYLEEVGVEPVDWDKSFRAAARYCRILIQRGHGELPA
jgi:hypothetical protein